MHIFILFVILHKRIKEFYSIQKFKMKWKKMPKGIENSDYMSIIVYVRNRQQRRKPEIEKGI